MPNFYEPSFITHPDSNAYIWRTWFLEECESHQLFGVNYENYLRIVEHGYQIGTEVYLEDAPYYWRTKFRHRICGPYAINASELPHDKCRVKHSDPSTREIVVYYDPEPEKGPWLDRKRVSREIEGTHIAFQKLASEFKFFPYRFRIKQASQYVVELKSHSEKCGWCPF